MYAKLVTKLQRLTISIIYGAIIPPTRAKKAAIPSAEFLITVGNISPEYKNITANAADTFTFPKVDKTMAVHWYSERKM